MREYTHALVEVSRDDFHLLIECLHHKRYSLHECLERKDSLNDERVKRYEKQLEQMENIEGRMKVRFCNDWPGDAV